ncbi:DUF7426 family protein [Nocardia bovistercoris]|uniref:DUF7426 domain-containing protein n=1 Tax=Nocardia bovistercoris TaxID=2785916 RepID=A0A931ICD8_9NOCA|nr:hypothetical protein [Nocardia bovistercoris]MBH0778824.1 hypothetical protein [Nocardia bovistercoris]
MAPYRELTEFYDPDLLLPIGGVVYRVKCPTIGEADRLRRLIVDDSVTSDQELEEIIKILGPVRDEMAANGVRDTMALHAGRTALLHFGGTPSLGRANWQLGQLGDLLDMQSILDAAGVNTSPEAAAD